MRRTDRLLLATLTLDGFVVGLLSMVFLNVHLGSVPFPISAVVGGVANGVLIWLASGHTAGSGRFAPLAGWFVAVGAGLLGGPGGDAMLFPDWRTLLLVVLGAGIPVVASWTGRLDGPTEPPTASATLRSPARGVDGA